jgi:phage recombination protein Bet
MTTTQITTPRRASILAKMADRFSVEPNKLLATLKATAFRSERITDEQMIALLIVADQYRLNPFTREVFAFPDKQSGIIPVVSIDGWSRIINEHEMFDGMSFVCEPDGSACTCVMYRKDRAHPIEVTEYLAECRRNTPAWTSHPRRMLRHKAMIQCARLTFGFGGIFDEVHEARELQIIDEERPARSIDVVKAAVTQPADVVDVPDEEQQADNQAAEGDAHD